MKRLIAILCVMLLLFSLAACRRNDYKNDNKKGNAKAPVTSTEAEGTTGEDKAFGIADTTANTDGQENDVPSKENTVANIIDEHKAELQEMVGEKGEVSADGGFIVLDLVDEAFDGMTDEQIAEYKSLLDRSLSEFDAVVAELKDDPECPDDFKGMRVNIKNSAGETIHTVVSKVADVQDTEIVLPSNENTVANMVENNKEELAEMLGDNCVVSADGGYVVYDVYMSDFDALTDEQLEEVRLAFDSMQDTFDEAAATIGAQADCPPDYEGIMVNYRNSLGDLIWSGIGTN